ncbi:MAG: riboflavin synthase [Clostridiales Family XIII bacterium]|jgi:riboflavin synthase|nr:riboflavin synthase [Clostridiales Family XIII bacterium]
MFTGIVEELGTVHAISKTARSSRLHIRADTIMSDIHLGDSIAVNGVCLTADELTQDGFIADVMPQTMQFTSLGNLSLESKVNLERAMSANGRFGGHIVSGHVDGIGKICNIRKDDIAIWIEISTERNLINQMIDKGSICLDGVSLTIAKLNADRFAVSLIPHTQGHTTLFEKRMGDCINIETDVVGKYISRFLVVEKSVTLTIDTLADAGFL